MSGRPGIGFSPASRRSTTSAGKNSPPSAFASSYSASSLSMACGLVIVESRPVVSSWSAEADHPRVFLRRGNDKSKTWMAGTSPAMTALGDGRAKRAERQPPSPPPPSRWPTPQASSPCSPAPRNRGRRPPQRWRRGPSPAWSTMRPPSSAGAVGTIMLRSLRSSPVSGFMAGDVSGRAGASGDMSSALSMAASVSGEPRRGAGFDLRQVAGADSRALRQFPLRQPPTVAADLDRAFVERQAIRGARRSDRRRSPSAAGGRAVRRRRRASPAARAKTVNCGAA